MELWDFFGGEDVLFWLVGTTKTKIKLGQIRAISHNHKLELKKEERINLPHCTGSNWLVEQIKMISKKQNRSKPAPDQVSKLSFRWLNPSSTGSQWRVCLWAQMRLERKDSWCYFLTPHPKPPVFWVQDVCFILKSYLSSWLSCLPQSPWGTKCVFYETLDSLKADHMMIMEYRLRIKPDLCFCVTAPP